MLVNVRTTTIIRQFARRFYIHIFSLLIEYIDVDDVVSD